MEKKRKTPLCRQKDKAKQGLQEWGNAGRKLGERQAERSLSQGRHVVPSGHLDSHWAVKDRNWGGSVWSQGTTALKDGRKGGGGERCAGLWVRSKRQVEKRKSRSEKKEGSITGRVPVGP